MKKALIIIAAIIAAAALVVWVISWFRAPDAVATSAARPWPGGMGRLDSAAERFPPLKANDASRKLMALASALPKNDVVETFVAHEITRGELTIGQAHGAADRRQGARGRRAGESARQRSLGVGGLARRVEAGPLAGRVSADDDADRGTDRRAHDQRGGLEDAAARAGVARRAAGARQRAAAARVVHYQSASYWKDGARIFPTKWLADSVEYDRLIAEELSNTTRCDVTMRMNDLGTDLLFVWRRAFRYRAEREATANALRVRAGQPIETKSACSDSAWSFDGTTLRFSREIATAPPDRPMPLVLRVKS